MPTQAAVAGRQREYYDAVVHIMAMRQGRGAKINRQDAFRRVASDKGTTAGAVQSAFYRVVREVDPDSVRPHKRLSRKVPQVPRRNGVRAVDSKADTLRGIAADLRAQATELEKRAAELDELEAADQTMRAIRAVVQGVNGA
jgi:hypothetical protein